MAKRASTSKSPRNAPASSARNGGASDGQITLVLQGGGALGAYQGGVYQALHEAAVEPDWVIGTSIGAINAGLIAGNAPENRLGALRSFWDRVAQDKQAFPAYAFCRNPYVPAENMRTIMDGIPGFFQPDLAKIFGDPKARLPVGAAGYYSTAPLKNTLMKLADLELLNSNKPRVTVGAASVRLGEMRYFDSLHLPLGIEHIMASGALPPAFPPVEVEGEYYWDGGVLSNTPLEAVFDDQKRRSGLIFQVQVWNERGETPSSMLEALLREKDMQYASRTDTQIKRQKQIHKLRHVIAELAAQLPEQARKDAMIADLCSYGCLTQMHIILLQAPALAHDTYLKDIDFTENQIRTRWDAGYRDTKQALEMAPWRARCDPFEGVIVHQFPVGAGAEA